MILSELKTSLKEKTFEPCFLLFIDKQDSFLTTQYIKEIAKYQKCEIQQIDEEQLRQLVKDINNIFAPKITNTLFVYHTNKFEYSNEKLKDVSNLIVTADSLDERTQEIFSESIIKFPALETWQIQEYAIQLLKGLDKNKVDKLLNICGYDIFRASQEISKLLLFPVEEQNSVFNAFLSDGVFSDLSEYTVFQFTDAIMHKSISNILDMYKEKHAIDLEPMGIITILYKNIRNVINVQLSVNPTPENTGLTEKQIWAIRNFSTGYYSKEQLVKIFELLISLDLKIKTGELSTNNLIDYILIKILLM